MFVGSATSSAWPALTRPVPTFVDAADVYSGGRSEEILGRALKGRRDRVVVATKFGNPMGEDPNQRGASRRWIVRAVEASLRRLGTDWIDLYQVHRPDPSTDIDETLGALSDLIRAGKVRAIGASTKSVAGGLAAIERGSDVVMVTLNPDHLDEIPVIESARRAGVGVLVKKALGSGQVRDPAAALPFVSRTEGGSCVVVGTSSASNLRSNAAAITEPT